MKQHYKNYLIVTIATSLICTNALADGFTEGRFFLGASTNIKNLSYDYKDTKVSKISPSLLFLFGYKFDLGKWSFITETDIGSIAFENTVGKNSKQEIELNHLTIFDITQKIGYNWSNNHLTYITAGLQVEHLKPEYKGSIKEDRVNVASPVVGLGYEYKLTKSLNLFTEFNFAFGGKIDIKDKKGNEIGEMKISTQTFKIGARYYF